MARWRDDSRIAPGFRRQFNGDHLLGPLVVWVTRPGPVRGLCGLIRGAQVVDGKTGLGPLVVKGSSIRWGRHRVLCVALRSQIHPWCALAARVPS